MTENRFGEDPLRGVFTFVRDHLLQQGQSCVNISGICAYRGLNGTKCAVGCLITDEAYDPCIEGVGVSGLRVEDGHWTPTRGQHWTVQALARCMEESGVPAVPGMRRLLISLQEVHDMVSVANWSTMLAELERSVNGLRTGAHDAG